MNIYRVYPEDGSPWLRPADVVARLSAAFADVKSDASVAEELGRQFLTKYRMMRDAGLGGDRSVSIELLEERWAGAIHLEIQVVADDDSRVTTIAKNGTYLELAFSRGTSARRQRAIATQVANALSYCVESLDND